MRRVFKNRGESRQTRSLAVALAVTAIVLASCGGGNGNEGDPAVAAASSTELTAGGAAEPILITTRMNLTAGKILDGSSIGDAPFCRGGTVKDEHGTSEVGLVDRTITCQDGTLRMGFDPQAPEGDTQSGPWRIISGTGAYKEWQGTGEMKIEYDPREDGGRPTSGRETFTGTVTDHVQG